MTREEDCYYPEKANESVDRAYDRFSPLKILFDLQLIDRWERDENQAKK